LRQEQNDLRETEKRAIAMPSTQMKGTEPMRISLRAMCGEIPFNT
jgi:hypothetical protein